MWWNESFVIVAVVDAFPIDFTAIDIIGQGGLEDMLDFDILNGATLHSKKIIFFIHLAPVLCRVTKSNYDF